MFMYIIFTNRSIAPNATMYNYEENKALLQFIIESGYQEENDLQSVLSVLLSISFSSHIYISSSISLILTRTQIYVIYFFTVTKCVIE